MFNGVSQLSEPNKLLIHASFVAQAPSVWDYQWVSAGVSTTDNSKSSLQGALSEWCANAMEAEEVHGHVSTWDVTAVTDMSSLLAGSCRFTFNEDVNAWDVGQVTNMNVRRRALRQGHKAPARTQLLRERPQAVCACAGAAQTMFYYASAFNQPLAAWDVGQVINMNVRRRPASGSQASYTHTPLWGPQAMCVCWRGAVYVLLRKLLQPARGSLGRRPGHQHGGAPPPCIMVTGLLRAQFCSGERPQTACVCWRGAVYVLLRKLFQPASGSLGRRPGYLHDRAPPPCVSVTGLHT